VVNLCRRDHISEFLAVLAKRMLADVSLAQYSQLIVSDSMALDRLARAPRVLSLVDLLASIASTLILGQSPAVADSITHDALGDVGRYCPLQLGVPQYSH